MSNLNFHVRHEVTPERVWDVIEAIVNGNDITPIIQAERQIARLKQLGMVSSKDKTLQLTALGKALYELGERNREIVYDLLHSSHMTLWRPEIPLENTPFWSYQATCKWLFARGEYNLDVAGRERLTSEISAQIAADPNFASHLEKTRAGAISFSINSLAGILSWLKPIAPPLITDEQFELRYYCPPQTLVLAVASVVDELNFDILLTPERREQICQVCLLATAALDRVLDVAQATYPQLLQPGTRTGSYGRFIRLSKRPTIEDFVQ